MKLIVFSFFTLILVTSNINANEKISSQSSSGDIFKYFAYREPFNLVFNAPKGLEKANLVFVKDKPSFVSYSSKLNKNYALFIFNRTLYENKSKNRDIISNVFQELYSNTKYKFKVIEENLIKAGQGNGKIFLLKSSAYNSVYAHVSIIESRDELYLVQILSPHKSFPVWNSLELCLSNECNLQGAYPFSIPIKFKKPYPNSDYYGCIEKSIDVSDLSPGKFKKITVGSSQVFVYQRTPQQVNYALKQKSVDSENQLPKWWPPFKHRIDTKVMKRNTRSIEENYFVFWRPGPVFGVYINYVPSDYSAYVNDYPDLKKLGNNWLGGFIDIKNFVIYDITGRPIKNNPAFEENKAKNILSKIALMIPMHSFDKTSKTIKLLCQDY